MHWHTVHSDSPEPRDVTSPEQLCVLWRVERREQFRCQIITAGVSAGRPTANRPHCTPRAQRALARRELEQSFWRTVQHTGTDEVFQDELARAGAYAKQSRRLRLRQTQRRYLTVPSKNRANELGSEWFTGTYRTKGAATLRRSYSQAHAENVSTRRTNAASIVSISSAPLTENTIADTSRQ